MRLSDTVPRAPHAPRAPRGRAAGGRWDRLRRTAKPSPDAEQADIRWAGFFAHGPYALLALATVVSAASAPVFMTSGEMYAAGGLVLVALAVEWRWSAIRAGVPEHAPAAQLHFALRTLVAFVLTWLNPLFSIYAVMGYFDAADLLPRRGARVGLLATAVTMAGSQSGGLPPASGMNWMLFGVLYVLNGSLCVVFTNIGVQEAERARQRLATIKELEDTNARLEQAMEENAGLHAQLLLQAREAGISDERRRIAAEIHDTIAQGLTGIIAQLQVVQSAAEPGLARQHLDRAADLARHSLGEARRSVHNLTPAALEHDTLPEALERTVGAWSDDHGVPARLTVTGTEEPLHDEVAATLLRIAEEALANTARHAAATRVGVTLSYMGDEVTLDIRDDGRGFDPHALPPRSRTGGFGLAGMRARAERIAGTAAVESEPGQGTAVSARVPLVRHG
ncbi:sensor histidine kinase [Streptomyces sp. t39]|uniref:sensor histidine kinase n=1 Tax=Streptomyces sp. t39 TaxID=1828156 RepID=UPI0011CD6634|nr:sensor histidine kinase [Streptomyces sp. t39]TXS57889.1 sensor histidine kinase [Streptomyces sp. t39]